MCFYVTTVFANMPFSEDSKVPLEVWLVLYSFNLNNSLRSFPAKAGKM